MRIAPGNGGRRPSPTRRGPRHRRPVAVARHAARERYGLVVIGPEAPLAAGVADGWSRAVPAFGPTRAAARLESFKAFAKEQMRGPASPPPRRTLHRSGRRSRPRRAPRAAAGGQGRWLAAGKGVIVPETHEEAEAAVRGLFAAWRPGRASSWRSGSRAREVSAFASSATRPSSRWRRRGLQAAGRRGRGAEHGRDGRVRPVPWFDRRRWSSSRRGLRAHRLADGARRLPVPRRPLRRD